MSTKQALNGSFSKPKGAFSQISNYLLRDNSLSLKAKGLFSLICSYITLPDFVLYKEYLKKQCNEGSCAFDSAWKELVSAGYLKHNRVRNLDGTFSYSYELVFDVTLNEEGLTAMEKDNSPAFEEKNQEKLLELPKKEKFSKKNITKNPENYSAKQNGPSPLSPVNPALLLSPAVSPVVENSPPVSYIYNKTLNNNTKSVSLIDQKLREEIKEQIDYTYFAEEKSFSQPEKTTVLMLVDFLAELAVTAHEDSKALIAQVDSCTIFEFLAHMKNTASRQVRYPVPYWKKVFFNYLRESALALVAV